MPAIIQIHEMSALDAGVDKTSGTVRFKKADNATVDNNDPIPIPDSGNAYSFTKMLRAYMAEPPDTQVENFRWYTDGNNGFGTGVSVNVKNAGATWAANVDTEMTGGSDLFGYTEGVPLDGDGTDVGPFGSAEAYSYIGDLIRMQMVVAATASPGNLPAETLTLAYDEI
jgi:hypothetical protein